MFLAAAAQFSLTQLKKFTAVGFNGRYAVSSILAGPILYVSNICPTLVPRQEDISTIVLHTLMVLLTFSFTGRHVSPIYSYTRSHINQ